MNPFLKSVRTLVFGTAGAQILMILASPFLTRLYTPQDFGLLAIFTSLLSILLILSTFRYELAIPLPKSDEVAENVFGLSLIIHTISVFVLCIFIYGLHEFIGNLIDIVEQDWILWLLPAGLFFSGLYGILIQWNVRNKKFGKITLTKFVQTIATLIVQFSGTAYGGVSLIAGQFLGQGAGLTSLAKPEHKRISYKGMIDALKTYKRFPKFSMPAGLFRIAGTELPVIFLAIWFSASSAGLYALTMRVLSVPASLIGSAVGQVFISDAPNAHRNGTLNTLVRSVSLKLIRIAAPAALVIIILGPDLFSLVFGAEWKLAGEYARWLSLWIYLVFISSPLTTLTTVLEKQKQGLIFHVVMFFLRGLALSVGLINESVFEAIIALSVVNTVGRLIFVCWLYKISGNQITEFLIENCKAMLFSTSCLSPLLFVLLIEPQYWLFGLVISLFIISFSYLKLLKEAY